MEIPHMSALHFKKLKAIARSFHFRFRCAGNRWRKHMVNMLDDGVGQQETQTLDDFRLWSGKALKSFFHIRGKSTDGSIDDLAAR